MSAEDQVVKDRLNKQHNKVEQEIKKYDEILKKNKNMRAYDAKKKDFHKHQKSEHHNSSIIERSVRIAGAGQDLIKINGVKLDSHKLDVRIGSRSKLQNSNDILAARIGENRLPVIGRAYSQPKGLLMVKYNKLR